MCGRYKRKSDKQRIAEAFHVNGPSIDSLVVAPNDDIRPTTFQPIIRADEEVSPMVELAHLGIRTLLAQRGQVFSNHFQCAS
jgi:putative SOS response-associated peptidase YedK